MNLLPTTPIHEGRKSQANPHHRIRERTFRFSLPEVLRVEHSPDPRDFPPTLLLEKSKGCAKGAEAPGES